MHGEEEWKVDQMEASLRWEKPAWGRKFKSERGVSSSQGVELIQSLVCLTPRVALCQGDQVGQDIWQVVWHLITGIKGPVLEIRSPCAPMSMNITSHLFAVVHGSQYSFPGGSVVKNPPATQMQKTWVWSLGPLEKGMVTHSSILAWEIPWTEEPGRLQFMGLQNWHNLVTEPQQEHGLKYVEIKVYCLIKDLTL